MIKDLRKVGMLRDLAGGIQIDINAVAKGDSEGSSCNHNCTTESGSYDCPAAFSFNKGLKKNFASESQIIQWVDKAAEGVRKSTQYFLDTQLDSVKERLGYPEEVVSQVRKARGHRQVEVNLFGGNPEMHPEVLKIIRTLKRKKYLVNFTTTGRRFMLEKAFGEELLKHPPDVIALSADDFDPKEFKTMLQLSRADIKKAWYSVPPSAGQRQKALEALYAARYIGKGRPQVLFNMVLHSGNMADARTMVEKLQGAFPTALLNPYPMQSSFMYQTGSYSKEYLEEFSTFVDWMLSNHSVEKGAPGFVPRLHYWMLLRTILDNSSGTRQAELLSGEAWRCYTQSLGGGYVQIGRSRNPVPLEHPGGKLGCFWNDRTITQQGPVRSAPQVQEYIQEFREGLGTSSASPCGGCLMPRLMDDCITTESGMSEELVLAYKGVRMKNLNY